MPGFDQGIDRNVQVAMFLSHLVEKLNDFCLIQGTLTATPPVGSIIRATSTYRYDPRVAPPPGTAAAPAASREVALGRILVVAAAALLTWLLWRAWLGAHARHPAIRNALLALMLVSIVLLVGALLGRLHWLAALPAALLPLLRRGWLLLGTLYRFRDVWRQLLGGIGTAGAGSTDAGGGNRDSGRSADVAFGAVPDRAQALRILGLEGRPTRAEIRAAYRRLIQRVHPDHGGTEHLAQQLNLARDVLLAEASDDDPD